MTTDERLDQIAAAVTALAGRFDAVDARFDAIDARFDAIDTRLAAMDARFDAVDARFDAVEKRFAKVDERFAAIDARFDRLDDYLLRFRTEMVHRLEGLEHATELLSTAIVSLDSRMPGLNKAVLEFGELTRTSTTDLTARVARLEEQMAKLLPPAA